MAMRTKVETGVDTSAPLKTLYHSHDSIVASLHELAELPHLAEQASRARRIATAALALFHGDVLQHHADEENDLFPAVLRSASPGDEHDRVAQLAQQLVAEHRELEGMWKDLDAAVQAVARGRDKPVDGKLLTRLVQCYLAHARLEEQEFLPLAQQILQRDPNHLAAVGCALHMRRVPDVPGFI